MREVFMDFFEFLLTVLQMPENHEIISMFEYKPITISRANMIMSRLLSEHGPVAVVADE